MTEEDEEEEDDAEDRAVCGGLGPPGEELLLAGVGELRGTDSRALTARRWSLLEMSELTVSSRRTFSCRSWCRHDSNDATGTHKPCINLH